MHIHTNEAPVVSHGMLERLALPFFLFAFVFAVIIAGARVLWFPQLLRVQVAGVARDVPAMQEYRATLQEEIKSLTERREELIMPLHDEDFEFLKARTKQHASFAFLHDVISTQAQTVTNQPDAIHMSAMSYQPDRKNLTLTGDVRFVGPRSMTVLAQFIDSLSALPFVTSLQTPIFDRIEDPKTGFHSPFTAELSL
jgi:hypothetical protein